MTGDGQLSLFGEPLEPGDRQPPNATETDFARIPTSAQIPIPPGTYPTLAALTAQCLGCQRCELSQGRTNVVVGRGNPEADVLIIGEGPGQHEDETGLPFVGKSGQLLEKILAAVSLSTDTDVYIANVVKCLTADTLVLTEVGYQSLGQLVRDRWSGQVLSLDPQRRLVWRPLVGWHQSPLAGRSLYHVTLPGQDLGYTATADHPVLTRRGWLPVADLLPGDLVATGLPAGSEARWRPLLAALRNSPLAIAPSPQLSDLAGQITAWQAVQARPVPTPLQLETVYCLEVADTANFITPAGVVHNCRPPGNRVPAATEIEACKPFLLEQIRLIDPKIVLFTGATALKALTGEKRGITKIRGQWLNWEGRHCMAIFHPAYLLRNPSREQGSPKWLMWQDIQTVRQTLDALRGDRA